MKPVVLEQEVSVYAFSVTTSAIVIVAARDETAARKVAEEQAWDAIMDARQIDVDYEDEVTPGSYYAKAHADEIPHYDVDVEGDDEFTVAELMTAVVDNPKPSEDLGPVHWCEECGQERVQFDGLKDRQICRHCTDAEVSP